MEQAQQQHQLARADEQAIGAGLVPMNVAPPVPRLRLERQCLSWNKVPLSPKSAVVPPPRSGAASVVVGGKLYVFGGYGGGTETDAGT